MFKKEFFLTLTVCFLIIFSSLVQATDSGRGDGGGLGNEFEQLGCDNSNNCREIDSVWSILISEIGFVSLDGSSNKYWNPYDSETKKGEWVEYLVKYPEPVEEEDEEEETCLKIDYDLVDAAFSTPTLDSGFEDNLKAMCDRLDIHYVHMLAVMKFESSLNPASVNIHPDSGATGLIQFMPSNAIRYGTTVDALKGMTASEQLPYIEKYFESQKTRDGFRGDNLGDVAMAVISPATIGKSDDTVMYSKGTKSYSANDILDINQDGVIKREEYISFVMNNVKFYTDGSSDCSSLDDDDDDDDDAKEDSSIESTYLSYVPTKIFTGETKVLMIGASHTNGVYGETIFDNFNDRGYLVRSYSMGGSRAIHWVVGGYEEDFDQAGMGKVRFEDGKEFPISDGIVPKFEDLLNQFEPDIIVISLGTNMINTGNRVENTYNLATQATNDEMYDDNTPKCYWIGPAVVTDKDFTKNLDEAVAEIKEGTEGYCYFIDATEHSEESYIGSDGIHFTNSGGISLANDVFDIMINEIE